MFRLLIYILLVIAFGFCRLCVSGTGFHIADKKRKHTVKARIMSNISMTLYWLFQNYLPFEIIKDEHEWDEIIGAEEVEVFAWD
nr:uncharacterized protein LOC118876831 [Drosophila suzukii]